VADGGEVVSRGGEELLRRAVVTVGDARLRVELQGQIRREGVVEAGDEAELRLLERREDVASAERRGHRRVADGGDVLGVQRGAGELRPEGEVPAGRGADGQGEVRAHRFRTRVVGTTIGGEGAG